MSNRPWIVVGWNEEPTMQRFLAFHVERGFVAVAIWRWLIGVRRP